MFIQLTQNNTEQIWININSINVFFAVPTGGTELVLSREDAEFTVEVTEEPYMVWARIRAEENTGRKENCK